MFEKNNSKPVVIPEITTDSPLWKLALGHMSRHHQEFWGMAIDTQRNNAYEQWIRDNVKDKVVCDLGSGGGLLLHLAEYYGAKKCIGIEKQAWPVVYTKGLYPHWEIIWKDFFLLDEWPEADIYLHEIFGENLYSDRVKQLLDKAEILGVLDKFYPKDVSLYTLKDNNGKLKKSKEWKFPCALEGTMDYHKKNSLVFEELKRINLEPMLNVNHDRYEITGEVYNGSIRNGWSLGRMRDSGIRDDQQLLGWEVKFNDEYSFSNFKDNTTWKVGNNWKW